MCNGSIGINFTGGQSYSSIMSLIDEGHIDYVELLIDNFLHLNPTEIAKKFPCPVAFHIMQSRFLEQGEEELKYISSRITQMSEAFQPLYISDHIALFEHNGTNFYQLAEINYAIGSIYFDKIRRWQDMLGHTLYLENYPSLLDGSYEAPTFFEHISKKTECNVLFDISNAVCASRNTGADIDDWKNVISKTLHYHVAGYTPAPSDNNILIDSHSEQISSETEIFIDRYADLFFRENTTITYERDGNFDYDLIVEDLNSLRLKSKNQSVYNEQS